MASSGSVDSLAFLKMFNGIIIIIIMKVTTKRFLVNSHRVYKRVLPRERVSQKIVPFVSKGNNKNGFNDDLTSSFIVIENALNTNKRSTAQTNGKIMKFVQSEVHALLIINIARFLLIYKRQLTYAVLVVLTSIAHCIGTVHGPVTHSYYPGTLCTIFWSTSLLNIS